MNPVWLRAAADAIRCNDHRNPGRRGGRAWTAIAIGGMERFSFVSR
jgi:hypothetical protein